MGDQSEMRNRESRENRLFYYREWEADFLLLSCRVVYPYPDCSGKWEKNTGPGADFWCPTCGREADAKYSGEMIDNRQVRFNCSMEPWNRYAAGVALAVRTAWDGTPKDVACLRGDGKIISRHTPSDMGTKEYGSTPYYKIEAVCYPILRFLPFPRPVAGVG